MNDEKEIGGQKDSLAFFKDELNHFLRKPVINQETRTISVPFNPEAVKEVTSRVQPQFTRPPVDVYGINGAVGLMVSSTYLTSERDISYKETLERHPGGGIMVLQRELILFGGEKNNQFRKDHKLPQIRINIGH